MDKQDGQVFESRSRQFLKQLQAILVDTLLNFPVAVIENEIMPFVGPEGFFIFEDDHRTLREPIPIRFAAVADDTNKTYFFKNREPVIPVCWTDHAIRMLNFIQSPHWKGPTEDEFELANRQFFCIDGKAIFQNGQELHGTNLLRQLYFNLSNINRDNVNTIATIVSVFNSDFSTGIV